MFDAVRRHAPEADVFISVAAVVWTFQVVDRVATPVSLAVIGRAVPGLGVALTALGILAVSVLAKFGACYAAARLAGEDNRTALGIGALMNSRGLMELIIINIGLQKGIIGPALSGLLITSIGVGYSFLVNAVSYVGVIAALIPAWRAYRTDIAGTLARG